MKIKDRRSSRNRKLEPSIALIAFLQQLDAEIRWLIASNGAWLMLRATTASRWWGPSDE